MSDQPRTEVVGRELTSRRKSGEDAADSSLPAPRRDVVRTVPSEPRDQAREIRPSDSVAVVAVTRAVTVLGVVSACAAGACRATVTVPAITTAVSALRPLRGHCPPRTMLRVIRDAHA